MGWKVAPTQPFGAVGVTVYLTCPCVVPVLFRVWAIVVPHELLQLLNPFTVPVNKDAVHVKVVELIVEFNAILVALLLQIV